MNKIQHLPYKFDRATKYVRYEMLWKLACLEMINKYIPEAQRPYTRVLDVGSGRGEMMQLLRDNGYQVEGFDADRICVELSSKYGTCKQGDIENIANYYPEKEFDVVISLHVIEHLENPKKCIGQFGRLSSKFVALATPNLSSFPFLNIGRSIIPCNIGHTCGWNHGHLANLLQNILQFEIVEWSPDCVRLYENLPYLCWLDSFIHESGLRALFEERILKTLFPKLSNSLIVLARSA